MLSVSRLVGFLFVLLAVSVSVHGDVCSNSASITDAQLRVLIAKIKSTTFSSDKLEVLQDFCKTLTVGFTGDQATQVLQQFTFSSDQITALGYMNDFILSLSANDTAELLGAYTFSSDKITCLQTVANYILRDQIACCNQTIVDAFTFSSDKEEALQILESATGRSCTWGPIIQKNVVFVLDTSGSMSTQFILDGWTYTRLSYIQHEIDQVIRYQLRLDQNFNILTFADSVNPWQPGLQPVNTNTVTSAANFAGGLTANGGTATYAALQAAYTQPNVQGIYFLSDGEPSVGPSAQQILDALSGWDKGRHIPVYATALATSSDGQAFMSQLAAKTGGVYRAINGD